MNVNPGLINPKRRLKKGRYHLNIKSWRNRGSTPLIFINHGLAKSGVDINRCRHCRGWKLSRIYFDDFANETSASRGLSLMPRLKLITGHATGTDQFEVPWISCLFFVRLNFWEVSGIPRKYGQKDGIYVDVPPSQGSEDLPLDWDPLAFPICSVRMKAGPLICRLIHGGQVATSGGIPMKMSCLR